MFLPRHLAITALLLVALGQAQVSEAKSTALPTTDRVIFVRDNALWQIAVTGGDAAKIADFPWVVETTSELRIASSGFSLVIELDGVVAWLPLSGAAGEVRAFRFLPCKGKAQLSPDGANIVCSTQNSMRIAVYTLAPGLAVRIVDRKALGPLFFAGKRLVYQDENSQLMEVTGDAQKIASNHAPSSSLRITPDGKRAVGDYREGKIDVVYTFKLDGKAVKRLLVQAARTLSISADSSWAAIQQEIDACAVRIAGGQYMCWSRFEAMDISSKGRGLLLSVAGSKVGHDLYVGSVSGTKSSPPTLIVTGVGKVAAFWSEKTHKPTTHKP